MANSSRRWMLAVVAASLATVAAVIALLIMGSSNAAAALAAAGVGSLAGMVFAYRSRHHLSDPTRLGGLSPASMAVLVGGALAAVVFYIASPGHLAGTPPLITGAVALAFIVESVVRWRRSKSDGAERDEPKP